jgi:hypothetical protein
VTDKEGRVPSGGMKEHATRRGRVRGIRMMDYGQEQRWSLRGLRRLYPYFLHLADSRRTLGSRPEFAIDGPGLGSFPMGRMIVLFRVGADLPDICHQATGSYQAERTRRDGQGQYQKKCHPALVHFFTI